MLALLSSCGFSLRGSDVLSSRYNALALDSPQPNLELPRLLRQRLIAADVAVLEPDQTDAPLLRLGNETETSRPVSINTRASAAQHEIRLSVTVSLSRGDEELLAPQTLIVERSYAENIELISGNQDEKQIILSEMRYDLVEQILRTLEATE